MVDGRCGKGGPTDPNLPVIRRRSLQAAVHGVENQASSDTIAGRRVPVKRAAPKSDWRTPMALAADKEAAIQIMTTYVQSLGMNSSSLFRRPGKEPVNEQSFQEVWQTILKTVTDPIHTPDMR